MSEYSSVERPFLQKLEEIGWDIIDHGGGPDHPTDPTISRRMSFGEVAIRSHFKKWVGKINSWATDEQLDWAYDKITTQTGSLVEANRQVFDWVRKGLPLPGKNEVTGEENPTLKLVDFRPGHFNDNGFLAINQFRVDTPAMAKAYIVPDIVCVVNGLPWIVIECKDLDVAEPLSDAWEQIRRYSNQRKDPDDSYAQDEGKESLFHANLFNVITHGTEARFGTITGEFDYYYNWTDIFPEKYRTVETQDGGVRQEVMIGGMFNKEILLDILKNFTLFTTKGGNLVKIVCRYNQYRAVGKMIERLRNGGDFKGRSGVVWHTQGSGKSLSMVFLVRKMRDLFDLAGWKIMIVVDRNDLEEQIEDDAVLTDEGVTVVETKAELEKLGGDTANLNLVMIHKFGVSSKEELERWKRLGIPPRFEVFGEINNREKVLILIDEAHRSQGGDMAKNLFIAFPNATRIGFTGTPLLTPRHKIKTAERFYCEPNEFIDTYKMKDAVRDRATVDVMYIGKTTADKISDPEAFDAEYEAQFSKRTEAERQEIMKRYGDMVAYLESEDRVREVSRDLLTHYVTEILPNGFKAMVVSASITAACRYKYELERLLPDIIAAEESKTGDERDEDLLAKLRMLKVRAVVSMQSNNEPAYITAARKEGQGREITDAFKKGFDPEKPETGIGILCVCDRLLTGFDAPIAQVMYLDRSLKEHGLMQAIARVNRMMPKKGHGLVVDYFGITKDLTRALGIYADELEDAKEELKELGEYFKSANEEIPELEGRFRKILQFFADNGIRDVEGYLAQTLADGEADRKVVEDVIALVEDMEKRAKLDALVKNYFDRLDLLFNQPDVQKTHWIFAKRLGYMLFRIGQFYKDPTMDLKWASSKVRRLIDKYVKNESIVQNVDAVSMLSDDFPKIASMYAGKKSQASAMEHTIRWQIKVKLQDKDPGLYQRFKDRLDSIISTYQGNWEQMIKEFEQLKGDLDKGREKDERFAGKEMQRPFYDCLKMLADKELSLDEDAKIVRATKSMCSEIRASLVVANFWEKPSEVKKLRDKIAFGVRLGLKGIVSDDLNAAEKVMNICKCSYGEILRRIDEMA